MQVVGPEQPEHQKDLPQARQQRFARDFHLVQFRFLPPKLAGNFSKFNLRNSP
jgi:hypothetical protein